MRLIVGLGNPGRPYQGTRHNAGYEVVEAVARKLGWTSGAGDFARVAREKFDGLALDGLVSGSAGESQKLLLLEPTTYMNLSGRSVQAALAFYQLTPVDLMVVLDDLALPIGKLRIRTGGSDGGHNGLKDIQRALGTDQYPRLRLGIGAPPAFVPGRDFVLAAMSPADRKAFVPAVERAAEACLTWIDKGIETAMNRFNVDASDSSEP